MKQLRFTEAQINGILKYQESGSPTAEVFRKHGISSATFYKYKARLGGMDVSEAQRLKALEDENAKQKKLLSEAILDLAILNDVSAKKNGTARCEAGGCCTCSGDPRRKPAPGVRRAGGGSIERSLSEQPSG